MPPQKICDIYKKYQKLDDAAVDGDLEVVDFRRGLTPDQKKRIVEVGTVSSEVISTAQSSFRARSQEYGGDTSDSASIPKPCTIYEHKDFDGLFSLGYKNPVLTSPRSQIIPITTTSRMPISTALRPSSPRSFKPTTHHQSHRLIQHPLPTTTPEFTTSTILFHLPAILQNPSLHTIRSRLYLKAFERGASAAKETKMVNARKSI